MSWETLLRLATVWGRARAADVPSRALDWFDALRADDVFALACTLPGLGAAVCTESGDLVPALQLWNSGAVVCMLLRQRQQVFPRQVLQAFCERIAALETRPDIAQSAAQLQSELLALEQPQQQQQQRASKRHKADDVLEGGGQYQGSSEEELSVSLGDGDDVIDGGVLDADIVDVIEPASPSQRYDALLQQREPSQQSASLNVDGAVASLREFLARCEAAGGVAVRGASSQSASVQLPADVVALLDHGAYTDRVRNAVADASDEVVRALFAALGSGLDLRISSRAHTALVSAALLPRIAALSKPVSRVLAAAVLECTKAAPRAAVDGLLTPLLRMRGDGAFGAPQAELVNRCLQDGALDKDAKVGLVRTLWEAGSNGGAAWNAHVMAVLQKALAFEGLEGALSSADLAAFVARISEQCAHCAADVKFGKLLQTFVNRFGALLPPATVEAALSAAESLRSIVRKPVVAKLKALLQ